jgi:uncharacterized protein YjiS (DUF1127 family)
MAHSSTDRICSHHTPQRHGFWARLWQARSVYSQRRALAQLSESQLQDIGLTREEATAESRRAAWDVPQHWRG